jgi:hypothetical protein
MMQHASFDNDAVIRDVQFVRSPAPRASERHDGERQDQQDDKPLLDSMNNRIATSCLDDYRERREGDEKRTQDALRYRRHRYHSYFALAPEITPTHTIQRKEFCPEKRGRAASHATPILR